ncbi:serine/threonine-protein kinase haspin homolog [Aristolochia californica]|uniref:serine/threonine-protein kinase haspin homolog n=1 Tax=Aristolochia californica TaxID=171875 RepID=UPI0035DC8813
MASQSDDLWSEIIAHEEEQLPVAVVYRRRRPENCNHVVPIRHSNGSSRLSIVLNRKISWKRSLSTRGRCSVVISAGTEYRPLPMPKEVKRKPRQAFPNKRFGVYAPDFSKERAYFQDVDSYELMEESPSPKKYGDTWATGLQQNTQFIQDMPSILCWLIEKKLTYSTASAGLQARISHTPIRMAMEPIPENVPSILNEQTPVRSSTLKTCEMLPFDGNSISLCPQTHEGCKILGDAVSSGWDLEEVIHKLSLGGDEQDPFRNLLMACGQSVPARLSEVFSQHCDLSSIVKIGEGTYGEAFKAGGCVCKIVPIDGDLRVNGEVQKRSAEVVEEVLLSWTLNSLRGQEGHSGGQNTCANFIETKDVRVCQGAYDPVLINAWEDWDQKHGSENDHPKEFSEKQCYIVFVLADGGTDLENFVLLNFDEAQSLLLQVTGALAVAEAAYEFEHRDLHWGNILLTRNGLATTRFGVQGREMLANAYGISVSIIDFTLSRINTGEAILFLDLSADPELFEGPKGDKQSETYRKMKEITEECWEESYPKTNVLWLQYLLDILLLKKTFKRTAKDEKDLRSFRKSLNSCNSAKDALLDPFFSNLWVNCDI